MSRQGKTNIFTWLNQKLIEERFNNWLGFIFLSVIILTLTYFISSNGVDFSLTTLFALLAVPVIIISSFSLRLGFYLLVGVASFMPVIERIFYLQIKSGTYIDLFIYLLVIIALIRKLAVTQQWSFLKEPITIMLFVVLGFDFFQLFNVNGNLTAWAFGIRLSMRTILLYFIAETIFQSKKDIFSFFKYWMIIALAAALYAFYQEFAGLPYYDLDWASKTAERINLLFIGGKWRKWSFVSDVASFGLFMSFAGLMAFLMSLSRLTINKRLLLILAGTILWIAMLFSGTRTAYAIVPVGVAFFVLLTINKARTIAFAAVIGIIFLGLFFAPIYNPTLERLRSAFRPSEDASMNVREENRDLIRPYIFSHPFGGGLLTTGSTGEEYSPYHPLAGFPPDSGFLKTLLETGWIGLILQMALYVVVLATGIKNYFSIRDPVVKGYFMAFMASFFALTVSLFSQMSMDSFPLIFIYVSNFVALYRLKGE